MKKDQLTSLYRELGPSIFSHCRRILRDNALAEDALQEVFIRLVPYLERNLQPSEVQLLVGRLATNHCLDVLKKRKREELPETLPELSGADLGEQLSNRDLFHVLLSHAAEELRAVALLHYLDGMSQEKIARALEISPRTVFSRLHEFNLYALETFGPRQHT